MASEPQSSVMGLEELAGKDAPAVMCMNGLTRFTPPYLLASGPPSNVAGLEELPGKNAPAELDSNLPWGID